MELTNEEKQIIATALYVYSNKGPSYEMRDKCKALLNKFDNNLQKEVHAIIEKLNKMGT